MKKVILAIAAILLIVGLLALSRESLSSVGGRFMEALRTGNVDHLRENLGADGVALSADVMQRLDALINQNTVSGNRYSEQSNREVDTEVFGA